MPPSQIFVRALECPYCGVPSRHRLQFENAKTKSPRTHAYSACDMCDETVVSLLTLRQNRVIQVEVFPQKVQTLLIEFPSCCFLNSGNDEDMIFLSDILAQFGVRRTTAAIEKLIRKDFDPAYWKKRGEQTKDFLKKYPALKDFFSLMEHEEPGGSQGIPKAKLRADELALIREDEGLFRALEHDPKIFSKEQAKKHSELRRYLEQGG